MPFLVLARILHSYESFFNRQCHSYQFAAMLFKLIYGLKRLFPWSRRSGRDRFCRKRVGIPPFYDELHEIALITDAKGHVIYLEPQREYANDPVDKAFIRKSNRRFNNSADHPGHDSDIWGLVLSKMVYRGGFLEHKRKAKSELDTKLIRALISADEYLGREQTKTRHSSKDPCKG